MFLYRCDKCKVDIYKPDDAHTVNTQARQGHLCDNCYNDFYVWIGWSKK